MLPKLERLSYRKEQSLWMRPSSSGRNVTQRSVLVNDVSIQQIGPIFKRQRVLLVLEYETDTLPKMTVNTNYFAQHPRREKILFRPRQYHKVILLLFYCFTTKTNDFYWRPRWYMPSSNWWPLLPTTVTGEHEPVPPRSKTTSETDNAVVNYFISPVPASEFSLWVCNRVRNKGYLWKVNKR